MIEIITFEIMQSMNLSSILVENHTFVSDWLQRKVQIDFYTPFRVCDSSPVNLLLINDGQDMAKMDFISILEAQYAMQAIKPVYCVAIHAGAHHRKSEYGVAAEADYLGRGDKAGEYSNFIFQELLPLIDKKIKLERFREKAFAGFSLGGLSALDIVWHHPGVFQKVGVFSGSFWWRSLAQEHADYEDDKHRIMHQQIRRGNYHSGLKFFLQCGNCDETNDRNKNGIIDSIDDTLDLIKELVAKGYNEKTDIHYIETAGGHDIPTWGRAMPAFLEWGWKK